MRATFIMRPPLFVMLSSVQFDGESYLRAVEIQDVGSNRMLPPETEPQHLLASESTPELLFCFCHSTAQSTSSRGHPFGPGEPARRPPPGRVATDLPLAGGGGRTRQAPHNPTSASTFSTSSSSTPR